MKKELIFGIIVGILVVSIVGWYLISPAFIVIESDEAFPGNESEAALGNITSEEMSMLKGDFVASAHDVMGKALVVEENGRKILRFEDFETINGPDVFIYLSSDLTNDDFVNLGEIKATKGNVNYEIPEGTDLEKYNNVLVWCRAFRVLFSYAKLK